MNRSMGRRTALAAISALALSAGVAAAIPGATSASMPIRIRITKLTEQHRTITVSGVISPSAALSRTSTAKPYVVLVRRESRVSYVQLSFSNTGIVPASGKFTLRNVKDTTGPLRRNRYGLEFNPAPGSGYSQFIFLFALRLTR